jgi:hypothetical protein
LRRRLEMETTDERPLLAKQGPEKATDTVLEQPIRNQEDFRALRARPGRKEEGGARPELTSSSRGVFLRFLYLRLPCPTGQCAVK